MRRVIPKSAITTIESDLNVFAGIPVALTRLERNKVKNVKLAINPSTIPNGRFFPLPPTVLERMIGRRGSMQGDRTVIIPPRNANASKIAIACY